MISFEKSTICRTIELLQTDAKDLLRIQAISLITLKFKSSLLWESVKLSGQPGRLFRTVGALAQRLNHGACWECQDWLWTFAWVFLLPPIFRCHSIFLKLFGIMQGLHNRSGIQRPLGTDLSVETEQKTFSACSLSG